MANTKISALTSATTPLGGTEVLPIVQSNTTVKVSVANLTAGRAISAASLALTNALTAANGGTGTSTAFTAGSVVFAGTSGVYSQKNASFFWDNTNNRLGIGTTTPAQTLEVAGNFRLSGTQVGSKIQQRQSAISVSGATTILDDGGAYGSIVVVNGSDTAVNRFCDLVFASTGAAPTVIASFTAIGSPAARTYTRSGSALQLAMASGTYSVYAMSIGF